MPNTTPNPATPEATMPSDLHQIQAIARSLLQELNTLMSKPELGDEDIKHKDARFGARSCVLDALISLGGFMMKLQAVEEGREAPESIAEWAAPHDIEIMANFLNRRT